ncbi:tRNA-uridine aminocarboxypropyltransferase [Photobacterium sp. GB-72]|uniref:tRNA-uridine aminocarboxypropyltransferase n=1 Tax=Photobacterium sp. GB-72 TaxID=2022105 RepID=UPI000D16459F|nr:DTW domain-containing protein [Photobacterium sp. GB-72]PSV30365.1 DTW domain-containing protein [Photobacterium sp. GB-72]
MSCPRCGFQHNCICNLEPHLQCPAHFVLLTHPRELNKDTNTGKLLVNSLPHCRVEVWQRTEPPAHLLAQLRDPHYQAYLVFPSDEQHPPIELPQAHTDQPIPLFIILDATWQEAKKMVRKSPWLSDLPRLALTPQQTSNYALRRNQQDGNLCTCEVGIALLTQLQFTTEAAQLHQYFSAFINTFHADKSGHKRTY